VKKKKFFGTSMVLALVMSSAMAVSAHADNAAPKGDLILERNQDFSTFNPDLAQRLHLYSATDL
jgi:ABC-type oligopeptide transport system substrate-binding subunit